MLVLGTLALFATSLFQIGIPWALGKGIDALRTPEGPLGAASLARARHFALLLGAFALGQAAIRIVSRVQIFDAGRNAEYDMRAELLRKLLELPPSYYRTHPTGDLMS